MIRRVKQALLSCQGESFLGEFRVSWWRGAVRLGVGVGRWVALIQDGNRWRGEDIEGSGCVFFADKDFEALAGPGEMFAHTSHSV
jgi:hypothetical protein